MANGIMVIMIKNDFKYHLLTRRDQKRIFFKFLGTKNIFNYTFDFPILSSTKFGLFIIYNP